MRSNLPYSRHLLPLLASVTVLILTACGPKKPTPTPTLSVADIYTAAAQTLDAKLATQKALIPTTPVPTNTSFPTLAPAPSVAPLPFGSATSAAGGGTAGCDNSTFISETVPDGTSVDAGKKFIKTWTLMNNGTCDWTTSYKLHFLDGDQMNGADTFVSADVPPGRQIEIALNLVAPTAEGTYKGRWQLENAASQPFGSIIWVQVRVGAATSTPGPTNTPGTPAASATPTLTATP
jgi:hypothetical protein